ncbi:MAG: hypothetical protein ABUL69_03105, partial [Peristeroidobacter soli]
SYQWTVVLPATNPPAVVGANTANATVIAPSTGSITLRLTVTDNQNRVDTADVLIEATRASSEAPTSAGITPCASPIVSGPTPGGGNTDPTPTPTPSSRGGGGGGGGSLGLITLTLLGLLGLGRTRQRRLLHFFRCN